MRIAVLSDTHNRLPSHLLRLLAGADEIWHLGDVTDPSCIYDVESLGIPFHVVRGNCDSCITWPWVIDLEREGFFIRLVHVPPIEAPPARDLVFHGHIHIPRNERVGEARFYCPGSVGKPRRGTRPSFAWLELTEGKSPKWEIVPI